MPTTPQLFDRTAGRTNIGMRNNPSVKAFRVSVADTLDQAFSSTTAMFTVLSGRAYRSSSIKEKGWGLVNETRRGWTWATFDLDDFTGSNVPPDKHIAFLRVEEQDQAGTFRSHGPILPLPTPGFFNADFPSLTLEGTAPNVTALASGLPDLSAVMWIALPRSVGTVVIRNTDSTNALFVGFEPGMPMFEIPAGESQDFFDAADREFFLRGDGGTATFSAYIVING